MDVTKYARTLKEVEDDLMFGALPDSDSSDVENQDYDAVNDETFGGEVPVVDTELEDYAAQTARLRLDDPVWNQPATSNAPDASQIPMPDSFFDTSIFFKSDIGNSFGGDGLGRSIWGTSLTSNPFSLWSSPDQVNLQQESLHDYMDQKLPSFFSTEEVADDIPNVPKIPAMPNAMTLEDLERSQATPDYETENLPEELLEDSIRTLPSIPASALSIEELERNIMAQSRTEEPQRSPEKAAYNNMQRNDGIDYRNARFGQPAIPVAPFLPLVPPPMMQPSFPPIPPMPPQFLPLLPLWMNHICGRAPFLPPNVPPPPPFLIHLVQVVKDPRIAISLIMQSSVPRNQLPLPNMAFIQQQQQKNSFRKPPGMPSGRTIQDLAFDAFAGYMSWKEREYLVKIQIMQCQGKGDSYSVDHYYLVWREKMIASGWTPSVKANVEAEYEKNLSKDYEERARQMNYRNQRREREKEREREREKEREEREKEPRVRQTLSAKFAGSLGLPSKSSTANPRHLLEMNVKSNETGKNGQNIDEEKRQAAQKKLRVMLMRLESAISLLIEAEELKKPVTRDIKFVTMPPEEKSVELSSRLVTIINEIMGDELYKVMQMGKGRSVIRRLLNVAPPKDQARVLLAVISASGLVNKKLAKEVSTDLVPVFYGALSNLSRDQLCLLLSALNTDSLKKYLVEKNVVSRDLLITLLYVCGQKSFALFDPRLSFLQSSSFPNLLWTDAASSMKTWFTAMSISIDEVNGFCTWLRGFPFPSSSQISQMLEAIISL